jgi:hypothetical protein
MGVGACQCWSEAFRGATVDEGRPIWPCDAGDELAGDQGEDARPDIREQFRALDSLLFRRRVPAPGDEGGGNGE